MNTIQRVVDLAERHSVQERSIGAILIDAGKLRPKTPSACCGCSAKRASASAMPPKPARPHHRRRHRTGPVAPVRLPYLSRGESKVAEEVVAAYNPFAPQVEALRALRSQLVLRWFDSETAHKALAITSPGRHEGRSWLTANLGVVFSQLGERTLVVDADMRSPRQHLLFGVENRAGLSAALSGRGHAGHHPAGSRPARSLGAAGRHRAAQPAGASRPPSFGQLLQQLGAEYDVILIDTPAGSQFADGQTVAVRAWRALMVAQRNTSRIGLLRSYADMLQQAGASVVGSVLTDR